MVNVDVARKVLSNIDAGLVSGLGKPVPGQMCIMAAINHAMGNPHGDNPDCVHEVVRAFDIRLNDSRWSSNEARAKGMRREGIAKLGSTKIDGMDFAKRVAFGSMTRILPKVLRIAAAKGGKHAAELEAAAVACESAPVHASAVEATRKASRVTANANANAYANANANANANAYANAYAYAYAYANANADAYAYAYAYADEILSLSADIATEALIACGSEGVQWLFLCDEVPVTP